jgi:curved DNA-binding protein CbpA
MSPKPKQEGRKRKAGDKLVTREELEKKSKQELLSEALKFGVSDAAIALVSKKDFKTAVIKEILNAQAKKAKRPHAAKAGGDKEDSGVAAQIPEVDASSEAWHNCKYDVHNGRVTFMSPTRERMQVTTRACGGSLAIAQRIARHMYSMMYDFGAPKEEVLAYRDSIFAAAVEKANATADEPKAVEYKPAGNYDDLQVAREASAKTIRHAFRRRALETHPDRKNGSRERFDKVVAAYEVLSSPHSRAKYDASLAASKSIDGRYYSCDIPGEVTIALPVYTPFTQTGDEDREKQLLTFAIKMWLQTFHTDITESDLCGVKAPELMAMAKFWSQANLRLAQLWAAMQSGRTSRKIFQKTHTKHIYKLKGGYHVQVTYNSLRVHCFTEGHNLEQAVDYLDAMQSMMSLARQRVESAAEDAQPLLEEELIHALNLQCSMSLQFEVMATLQDKKRQSTPWTSDIRLAMKWWRDLKMAKKLKWQKLKGLCQSQARENFDNHRRRVCNAEMLVMNKLQMEVNGFDSCRREMMSKLEDMRMAVQTLISRMNDMEQQRLQQSVTDVLKAISSDEEEQEEATAKQVVQATPIMDVSRKTGQLSEGITRNDSDSESEIWGKKSKVKSQSVFSTSTIMKF